MSSKESTSDTSSGGNIGVRVEIPSGHENKGFVIIRQPERQFNVSKDNVLAQRDLRRADVQYKDWALADEKRK